MRSTSRALLAPILLTLPLAAGAAYPDHAIRLMVGFAAGGGTDTTARAMAPKMSDFLGQQVVVDNHPGAGGAIANEILTKSTPDGYTIMLSSVGPLTVNMHFTKVGYDTFKDQLPVSLGVTFPNILVVNPQVKANNLAEYVALGKSPQGIDYGSSGVGSAGHLSGALLNLMIKGHMQHISYKGGGPAMSDLLGNNVASVFASAPTVVPQVKAGKIRALASTGPKRFVLLPDVPTIAESGFPGYSATNWYAFVAPAKTPRDIIMKLNAAVAAAQKDKATIERLGVEGIEPVPSTPEEMTTFMHKEYDTWGKVVKAAGIKPE
ncbi:MAG TPA: tripartite tricarboxylate transporter substrate binding protein [Burkholderiales bacterium]|jgi:tripartite-type tricarboxylate transporter receptor subunit TctC|nr:tripartite tricarboxylate transporter substrate binding protein [Burkholderiales bacterium]